MNKVLFKKMIVYSGYDFQRVFDFEGDRLSIFSNKKNSQGKTTVLRLITYCLGLIEIDNFVDGASVQHLKVELSIQNGENEVKIIRDKVNKEIRLYNGDNLFKVIKISDSKYIYELEDTYKNMLGIKFNFLSSFAYSHINDQNYGSKTLNRGRTGLYNNKLKFSIEDLLVSLEESYDDLKKLENIRKIKESFVKDYDFIISNTATVASQTSLFDEIENQETLLLNLKSDLQKAEVALARKKELKDFHVFFKNRFSELNLHYKNEDGVYKMLTIDNFHDGIIINEQMIKSEINSLSERVEQLELKISLERKRLEENGFDGKFELLNQVNSIKKKIINTQLKLSEEMIEKIRAQKSSLEDNYEVAKFDVVLSNFEKIHVNYLAFLKQFGEVNVDVRDFHSKILAESSKNVSDLKRFSVVFESSKFTSYVGAIRFAITISLKFAFIKYMNDVVGVCMPIIFDSLLQEELDNDMIAKFQTILESFDNQIFISSLGEKNDEKYQKIVVAKDIFEDSSLKIFGTYE